jgi:hypothetical protein
MTIREIVAISIVIIPGLAVAIAIIKAGKLKHHEACNVHSSPPDQLLASSIIRAQNMAAICEAYEIGSAYLLENVQIKALQSGLYHVQIRLVQGGTEQ